MKRTKSFDRTGVVLGLATAIVLLGIAYVAFILINLHQTGRQVKASYPEASSVTVNNDNVPGILGEINRHRITNGLKPLELNAQLSESAQAKSDDLVDHAYFSHYRGDVDPWDFIDASGYGWHVAGENLAKCYETPEEIVTAWIESPAHNAVLLGDYDDAGFGTAKSELNGCDYVTGHFGSRV